MASAPTYADLRAQSGLRGALALIRHYSRRERSARDLAQEMRYRHDVLPRGQERTSLWERWQYRRFALQMGRHKNTCPPPAIDVLVEYYRLAEEAAARSPQSPTGGDGDALRDLTVPARPGRRSRLSPFAAMSALGASLPAGV